MSFIVEFEVKSPFVKEAHEAVPAMTIEYETTHISPDGSARYVFWAQGDDFERFEDGLENDPTIQEYALLAETDDSRLYRVILTEEGRRTWTYPVATKHDMSFLKISQTPERSLFRARVPSREALYAYRDACRERDIPFRLNRIYSEELTEEFGSGHKYGVTKAQREAMVTALESGYFEVPRETTLEDVANELGITTQALSTRLRRGQTNLIRNVLATEVG